MDTNNSNNNTMVDKVKKEVTKEINNAKNIISNVTENEKSPIEKAKSIFTPKNDSKNINQNSKINEKPDDISNNISNTGNGDEHSKSSTNENVSNTNNSSNNINNSTSNLAENLKLTKSGTTSNNNINVSNNSSNSNMASNSNFESNNSAIPEQTTDVEVLDELSKSCQLAMSNISFLSTKIGQKDIKNELVSIYSGYTDILSQINKNFCDISEIPSNVSPNLKMIGICSINLNTKIDKSSSHIAEIMIQGLNMGIIKCQKLLNSANKSNSIFNSNLINTTSNKNDNFSNTDSNKHTNSSSFSSNSNTQVNYIRKETLDLTQQFLDFQEQSIQRLKVFL